MSKRPSGCQQRKAKQARLESDKALQTSLLKFIKKRDEDEGVTSENEISLEKSVCVTESKPASEDSGKSFSENDPGQSSSNITAIFDHLTDIAHWKIPLTDTVRVEIVNRGFEKFQNKDGPFESTTRSGESAKGEVRQLSNHWFYRSMPNGENVLRSWMAYSRFDGKLYCFCCRLFATETTQQTSSFVIGFQQWWKLSPKLPNHENSNEHLRCLETWKSLEMRLKTNKTIDDQVMLVLDKEKKHWRDILRRLLDITLFLVKQNLPFRGHDEDDESLNKGNFLELVELISKYDTVLQGHLMRLKNACNVRPLASYLSPETQNEFIEVLGNHVKEKIIADIKEAKYYGIMFDSTPDISHIDQMSAVIRYVKICNRKVEVKEAFLGFFPLKGKKAVDLYDQILNKLEGDKLDIMMCRSQGFDNALVMSGIHGGVQALIKQKVPTALFNGCIDHSLNLCGQHSFAINTLCVRFFGTLEAVYAFFAGSTHRWDVLKEKAGVSLKRLSTTRWSSHKAAVKAVQDNFDGVIEALQALCDPTENVNTRGTAQGLIHSMCDYNFICFAHFWCAVLEEVDEAQIYLQEKGLTMDRVAVKLKALELFLEENSKKLVEESLRHATAKCIELDISTEKRVRFKKLMPGETSRIASRTLQEEAQEAMYECLDKFKEELITRKKGIDEVMRIFAAVQPKNLIMADEQQLEHFARELSSFYDDISEQDLLIEIPRFRRHVIAAGMKAEDVLNWNSREVLAFIVEWDFLETLPTLVLCLKLFLTICVSVASNERSFSKLKLIKSYLRSVMSQSRLNSLAILSIENELAKAIDFDDVINNFASIKARRVRI